jgi:two-component system, cell cycle sensor histidine kinase and response regulator CckA
MRSRPTPVSRHEFDDGRAASLYWLTAGTAHDINNLLTVLIGCAELALADAALQPQTRQLVRDIVGAGERAGLLTRQLLLAGRPPVSPTTVVDVAAVLREAEALLRRLVGPGVSLHVAPGTVAQRVRAEASQIEQIVVNLALNARDAMPAGGALTIVVSEVAGVTRLTVTDTGSGIDPAIQGRMYEAFVTTKVPPDGSDHAGRPGLGLAVVRAIVAQLGGSIHMTTAPGCGTTFAIDLPRASDPL